MNQELFSKYRIFSLTASGLLVLWYFFDANISKIKFLKDLELQNQQIIAYILVFVIIFCTAESLVEYSKTDTKSWQLKIQLLSLIVLPLISLIISYPKLTTNTFLQETGRLDLIIPIISSVFTSIAALQLSFEINTAMVFYKFRKTILPAQIAVLVFSSVLVTLGIASVILFSSKEDMTIFPIRYLIFAFTFLIFFIALAPREKVFSEKKLDRLAKQSASLDRQVETSEYISSLRKPPSLPRRKIHKRIMKTIRKGDEEQRKSIFPRFIMLKEITFEPVGAYFVPNVEGANDDEPVLRVNLIKKDTEEIVESEDVNFKYVKMACKQVPKLTSGNDVRSFLTPMANTAYSIHLFHESDPNELMLKFATSDEYISNLKELFKNRNPDINYVASNGWSALLISVANGEEKTANYLLQKAADPGISTKHGAAPLHFASKYGKLSLCKILIDYQADLNQRDIDGLTALMIAARFGHSAIVKLLIQCGADSQLIDDKQKTALSYATEGNYGDICKQLKQTLKNRISK